MAIQSGCNKWNLVGVIDNVGVDPDVGVSHTTVKFSLRQIEVDDRLEGLPLARHHQRQAEASTAAALQAVVVP